MLCRVAIGHDRVAHGGSILGVAVAAGKDVIEGVAGAVASRMTGARCPGAEASLMRERRAAQPRAGAAADQVKMEERVLIERSGAAAVQVKMEGRVLIERTGAAADLVKMEERVVMARTVAQHLPNSSSLGPQALSMTINEAGVAAGASRLTSPCYVPVFIQLLQSLSSVEKQVTSRHY